MNYFPQPLIIKAKEELNSKGKYSWNQLDDQSMQTLMRSIDLPELSDDTQTVNRLVSGIPSPWARTLLFKYAFIYDKFDEESTEISTGIYGYFEMIREEWKALIACIALQKDRIQLQRMYLGYEDGADKLDVTNSLALSGSLGNMLFDDRAAWSVGSAQKDEREKDIPFIDLIRLDNQLVGATSPYTIVFSNARYSWNSLEFVEDGFFRLDYLTSKSLLQLALYVQNIQRNLERFFTAVDTRNQGLIKFIEQWSQEISEILGDRKALLPNFESFSYPFSLVLNTSTEIGYYPGSTIFVQDVLGNERAVNLSPSQLLLPATTQIVEVLYGNLEEMRQSGAYLIEVNDPQIDKPRFFVLPLSEKGLKIFGDSLGALLNYDGEHSLIPQMEGDRLKLTLELKVDTQKIKVFDRSYPIHDEKISQRVAIIWPNFKSPLWKRYYFYSNFIHNLPGSLAMRPIMDHKLIPGQEDKNELLRIDPLSSEDQIAELIVKTPDSLMGNTRTRYEVYQSEYPFWGAELLYGNEPCGFLINKGVERLRREAPPQPVRVGIDFGSTNTCVSYANEEGNTELVHFHNRRVFLVGSDFGRTNHERIAKPDELFFFQNEEPIGIVKSMIMINNRNRFNYNQKSFEEITGGIPVFEKNIPVTDSASTEHFVRFDSNMTNEPEVIKHNMKWRSEEDGRNSKAAYMRSLWLMMCAELFQNSYYPGNLIWSYPLSMSWNPSLISAFQDMWNNVAKIKVSKLNEQSFTQTTVAPYVEGDERDVFADIEEVAYESNLENMALTESEAVCLFAIGPKGGLTPRSNSLVVGFDMGGSTTDLLIIGKHPEGNSRMQYRLVKQSSIKVAASKLSEIAGRSKSVQKVLKLFCERQDIYIYGIEDINDKTAPYLLNTVFDRLAEMDRKRGTSLEKELYGFFWSPPPTGDLDTLDTKGLFTTAAYIAGLTCFYAGQLIGQALKDPAYASVNEIDLGFFGNGGKLFDWFKYPDTKFAEQFYKACVAYGVKTSHPDKKFLYRFQSTKAYQKNEVSLGLSGNSYLKIDMDKGSRNSDIIGEENYTFDGQPLSPYDSLDRDHLIEIGNRFQVPENFEMLQTFLALFVKICRRYNLLETNLDNLLKMATDGEMRFTNYIQNNPEFISAQRQGANLQEKFDYIASPFVLEAMCFLDNIILKDLYSPKS